MNIEEVLKQIKELRKKLLEMIDQMPDAQTGVKQINKSPAIAIVTSSHVSKNEGILNPSYYLYCEAKEALKNLIQRTQIENLPDRIQKVIQSGQINVNHNDSIKLNPEFISFLKYMWKGALND